MKTKRTTHVDVAGLMKKLGKLQTRVGWFEGKLYPDGTPVALVATVQEYGSPANGIPPRPFFRPTVSAQRTAWKKIIADGTKAMLRGSVGPVQVMEGVGLQAQGDFKKAIAKVTTPPLAKGTLRARTLRNGGKAASAKPLNDTGYMLATLITQTEEKQ